MASLNIKSGFLTSEFWVTLANNTVAVFVLLGYLSPAQADEFVQAVMSIISGVVIVVSTVAYLYGRIALKRAAITSSTQGAGVQPLNTHDSGVVTPKLYAR